MHGQKTTLIVLPWEKLLQKYILFCEMKAVKEGWEVEQAPGLEVEVTVASLAQLQRCTQGCWCAPRPGTQLVALHGEKLPLCLRCLML